MVQKLLEMQRTQSFSNYASFPDFEIPLYVDILSSVIHYIKKIVIHSYLMETAIEITMERIC